MSSAMSKPVYLKMASTVPSFSVENGCSRADVLLRDDEERLVVRDREAGASRPPRAAGARDRVGRAMAVGVPIRGLQAAPFRRALTT